MMWCVRRWPSPRSCRCSSQGPAEVRLLPTHREVGFRGSPALLGRLCGCSCIHYLVPTAPNRGPREKQTPRGLAEEAGERFPSPCRGCCRCPCSPWDSGTSYSWPARNGAVRGSALSGGWRRCPGVPGPPHGLAPREFLENKAFQPVGEM